jgi:hypothetical protein
LRQFVGWHWQRGRFEGKREGNKRTRPTNKLAKNCSQLEEGIFPEKDGGSQKGRVERKRRSKTGPKTNKLAKNLPPATIIKSSEGEFENCANAQRAPICCWHWQKRGNLKRKRRGKKAPTNKLAKNSHQPPPSFEAMDIDRRGEGGELRQCPNGPI